RLLAIGCAMTRRRALPGTKIRSNFIHRCVIQDTRTLAPLVLGGAEQGLVGLVIEALARLAAVTLIREHLDAALHGLARADRVEPALEVRELGQVLTLALVRLDPRPAGNVRDRVLAPKVFGLAQTTIHDPVDPPDLVGITLDRIVDRFGG